MRAEEIVTATARLLHDPRSWHQGSCALDANGRYVGALDEKAVKWCLWGAVERVVGGRTNRETKLARFVIREAIGRRETTRCIVSWNDRPRTEHRQVLTVLRSARRLLPGVRRELDAPAPAA